MSGTHPYISGAGNIAQMVNQLRRAFPPEIDSNTIKKLGIASNNESYVINALQFVRVIDEEGKKTKEATVTFSSHKDEDFFKEFSQQVKKAYSELFELHGDAAWELPKDELITFFRRTDDTSAAIGGRQASTFHVFAALSGHGELPSRREPSKTNAPPKPAKLKPTSKQKTGATREPAEKAKINKGASDKRDVGLTVRIEINLPADGSRETYDNIFKSIRENLIDE